MKRLVKLLCFLLVICNTQTVFADEENTNQYKVVEFKNNDGCLIDVTYNNKDSFNGCLGIDAAYLYENDDQVYFMISGSIGHTNIENVTIHDAKDYLNRVSSYKNIGGVLYHNIKTNLESDYYSFSFAIDDSPEYLKEGVVYYSYDGHYFYDDYSKMIDDYISEEYSKAVNEKAYYNYYQYVPFRSMSNYTYEEINDYVLNKLHINGALNKYFDYNYDGANDYVNKSQYYNNLQSFFVSEEAYGVNALSLLAISMAETSYGKTLSSYLTNNLFASAAFSSQEETENQKYNRIENSVYAFAKYYLADRNSNPIRNSYNGSFLGNKLSGMNRSYSNDPYWAEKVAANYYMIDSSLGYKDKDSLTIAIVDNPKVYSDKDLKNRIYSKKASDYAYVVLNEEDNSYKVQLDKNDDLFYDYQNNVAYISKEDIYLIGSKTIEEKTYDYYQYEFNGGSVDSSNDLKLITSKEIVKPIPYKEGYEFVEYKDNVPVYRQISKVALSTGFDKTVELNSYPDLQNAKLIVHYQDGTYRYQQVTSQMIESYDYSKDGSSEVVINYNGVKTTKTVKVSQWPKLIQDDVNSNILKAINNNTGDISYVKENINGLKLDFNTIRKFDEICLNDSSYPVYYIQDNNSDLSFSGLSFSLTNQKKKGRYQLYDDTFYVKESPMSINNYEYLKGFAKDYGFETVGSTNITYRYNLLPVKQKGPIIVQVKIEDKENDKYYSVYHLDTNGDVVKCKVEQTNSYIQFITYEDGDYIFLSRPSGNIYDIEDKHENISSLNNGIDSFNIMFQIFVYLVLMLYNFVCVVIYYLLLNNREKRWNDYRRSLRLAVSAREEKQKN